MLVTFTIDNENFSTLDVSQDLEVENFLALVAMENPSVSTNDSTFVMIVNGRQWKVDSDVLKMKLYEIGVGNNDMIAILKVQPRQAPGTSRPPMGGAQSTTAQAGSSSGGGAASGNLADLIRSIQVPKKSSKPKQSGAQGMQAYADSMVKRIKPEQQHQIARNLFIQMSSPLVQLRFKEEYPSAVIQFVKEPTNYEAFYTAMINDQKDFYRRLALTADPTSIEGQKLIADLIKREAHKEQLNKAMTEMPEAFIRSHMLYVKLKINGVETIGFVDSGAQVTTISLAHAEKFNLTSKIDKTYATILRGVGGEQTSEGRIHSADIEVNGHVFPAPLSVLPRFGEDILIGLDTLRRHGACIDLGKNVLRLGTQGIEVPFLNERQYADECKRLGIHANVPVEDKEPIPEYDVSNEKVAELVDLGFDAHMALKALAISHNDTVYACDLLQSDDPTVKEKLQSQQPGPSNTSDDKPKEKDDTAEPMDDQ
uniref:UBA domain-containing protein n=1 Tax=Panagrolaimus sp. ES5 TaxID=591445 RepID=A0AC34GWU5_9BILA